VTAIETDAFLPHPISRVWRAITSSRLLAEWLMPNDFVAEIGHRFTFTTEPVPSHGFDGVISCEVLELDAPTLLTIAWRSSDLDSTVRWRLIEEGTGTRLFLTHDGFDPDNPAHARALSTLGGGWRGHLARRLEETLATMP
jgi:uncharacterized protein YndB with AHSA1/START domain